MQNRELQGSYIQAVAESYESQGSMDRKFSEMPLPQHGLVDGHIRIGLELVGFKR